MSLMPRNPYNTLEEEIRDFIKNPLEYDLKRAYVVQKNLLDPLPYTTITLGDEKRVVRCVIHTPTQSSYLLERISENELSYDLLRETYMFYSEIEDHGFESNISTFVEKYASSSSLYFYLLSSKYSVPYEKITDYPYSTIILDTLFMDTFLKENYKDMAVEDETYEELIKSTLFLALLLNEYLYDVMPYGYTTEDMVHALRTTTPQKLDLYFRDVALRAYEESNDAYKYFISLQDKIKAKIKYAQNDEAYYLDFAVFLSYIWQNAVTETYYALYDKIYFALECAAEENKIAVILLPRLYEGVSTMFNIS